MPAYATQLQRRRDLTEGAAAFVLARPEGFTFQAGQSINLTLVDPPEKDAKGNTRTFSLVSAPHEPFLEVATRLRTSAFKRVLAALPPGAPLQFRGPGGKFTLGEDERPAVLLAGGIGITPFVSMLRDAAQRMPQRHLTLMYANRRIEDAAYLAELQALRRQLPNLRLVPTVTGTDAPRPASAEAGPIDRTMVARHVADLSAATFFVAGPPAMVSALKTMLVEAGVDAAQVRIDEFYGY
ncbi:MAG TPA: FAD-dependent oxidoreductase [Usitatibacter sp.]|nr:FAD-dependent oxidoreductase [Usitatibacter sp.]